MIYSDIKKIIFFFKEKGGKSAPHASVADSFKRYGKILTLPIILRLWQRNKIALIGL